MSRQIPFGRLAAEFVVIVVGVLVALAADSWWQSRQDRAAEDRALRSLLADFEAASAALERQVAAVDSAAVAAEALLGLVSPEADLGQADSLAQLLPRIIRRPTFHPPTGTLNELLGSGTLSLIQNDSLRAKLASFHSQLEGLTVTQEYGSRVVFDQLVPYLNQHVPMLEYGLLATGESSFGNHRPTVLRSMEFENLVQTRLMGIRFTLLAMDDVGEFILSVRRSIEVELGT